MAAPANRTLEHEPVRGQKPAGLREFTPRAIVCGLLVAVVMGASYPYVVLKLGFGPNVSVVAAFLPLFVVRTERFPCERSTSGL